MEIIRAIYIGDLRYNECPVFEYCESTGLFEMINDRSFSYDKTCVFEDSNFLVFAVENDEVKQITK